MEQIAFKIMAFMLTINLATGLFMTIGAGAFNSPGTYDANYQSTNLAAIDSKITGAPVEPTSSTVDRILDFFTLGMYQKVTALVKNTLFAFPTLLTNLGIFPLDAGGGTSSSLANMFNIFLTTVYIAGVYELFTGKSIIGG